MFKKSFRSTTANPKLWLIWFIGALFPANTNRTTHIVKEKTLQLTFFLTSKDRQPPKKKGYSECSLRHLFDLLTGRYTRKIAFKSGETSTCKNSIHVLCSTKALFILKMINILLCSNPQRATSLA